MQIFQIGGRPPRGSRFLLYVPGAVLLAIGVCVLLLPNLLRILVAGFFICTGLMMLLAVGSMQAAQRKGSVASWFDSMRGPR